MANTENGHWITVNGKHIYISNNINANGHWVTHGGRKVFVSEDPVEKQEKEIEEQEKRIKELNAEKNEEGRRAKVAEIVAKLYQTYKIKDKEKREQRKQELKKQYDSLAIKRDNLDEYDMRSLALSLNKAYTAFGEETIYPDDTLEHDVDSWTWENGIITDKNKVPIKFIYNEQVEEDDGWLIWEGKRELDKKEYDKGYRFINAEYNKEGKSPVIYINVSKRLAHK